MRNGEKDMKYSAIAAFLAVLTLLSLSFSRDNYEESICEDPKYLKLKKRDIKELDEKEYGYFVAKDKACDDLRIAIKSNEKNKTPFGTKFLTVTTGLISVIMLYLLINQLGS
jgi:hypothetical protein